MLNEHEITKRYRITISNKTSTRNVKNFSLILQQAGASNSLYRRTIKLITLLTVELQKLVFMQSFSVFWELLGVKSCGRLIS